MIDLNKQLNKDLELQKIIKAIGNQKFYIVGGYIRDALRGKISNDIDVIFEDTDARQAAEKLSDELNGHFVVLDEENGIYRVVLDNKITCVDIVNPVENDIKKDIQRRDFTINAICYDVQNKEILDLTGGIEDLKKNIIRPIDEKNFFDDPLRVLRAFRFLSSTGGEFSTELPQMLKKYVPMLANCATERVNCELTKLFEGKNAHTALAKLDEIGLLETFFPVIKDIKKIPPNSHHHLPLFEHSLETVRQAENVIETLNEKALEHILQTDIGQSSRKAYLKLACFLHDIGKPSTWTIEPDTNRHRFIKHDEAGAEMVHDVLKPLKYSNKQITYVKDLIRNHIYPAALAGSDDALPKANLRFFRKLNDNVIDVIILAQADRLSARGADITEKMIEDNINSLNALLQLYIETKDEIKPLPKLLSGNEIMELFHIPQLPKLGEVIKALHEEQLNGNIKDKEEAIDFVKKLF